MKVKLQIHCIEFHAHWSAAVAVVAAVEDVAVVAVGIDKTLELEKVVCLSDWI